MSLKLEGRKFTDYVGGLSQATDQGNTNLVAKEKTTGEVVKVDVDGVSQNALAGNVAPAFDPTRDEDHPYLAGESVVYYGKTYTFKVDHYGAWSAADVEERDLGICFDRFFIVDNPEYNLAVVDRSNHFLFGIDKNGNFVCNNLEDLKGRDNVYATAEELMDSNPKLGAVVTCGFHRLDDGGGAVYEIVDSLEEGESVNGMDVLQVGSEKFAKLKYSKSLYLEQLGLIAGDDDYDASPYFSRAFAIGVTTILLRKTAYCIFSTIVVPFGTTIEGESRIGTRLYSYFDGSVFVINHGRCTFKNFTMTAVVSGGSSSSNCRGIYFGDSLGSNSGFSLVIENVYFEYYGRGVVLYKGTNWCCRFTGLLFNQCGIGMYVAYGFCLKFNSVDTWHCIDCGIRITGSGVTAEFDNCNFGTDSSAIDINQIEGDLSCLTFIECNFEYDTRPESTSGGFVKMSSDSRGASLAFIGCHFVINSPQGGIPENSYDIALSGDTKVVFENCILLNEGEGYTGESFFNPNILPSKAFGTITYIGRNYHVPRPNLGDAYEGLVIDIENGRTNPVLKSDYFDDYKLSAKAGTLIYEPGEQKVYVFNGTSFNEIG